MKKSLGRHITLSSELVPFQEIDVYAKESGYVKKLMVDYGTHVKAGQLMAVLEIPELEAQLEQDQAEIKDAYNQVSRAQHEFARYQAQFNALHLQYTRLKEYFKASPASWLNRKWMTRREKIWRHPRKSTQGRRLWKVRRASSLQPKPSSRAIKVS